MLREALPILKKLPAEDPRPLYYMNLLGGVLVGKGKYVEAEPLLLQGYEEMKRLEATLNIDWRNRIPEACERVVRFYEATKQVEKAREWRDKLAPPNLIGR